MSHSTISTARILPVAAFILATASITGASIHAIAAPVVLPVHPQSAASEVDPAALVRAALDRIGGKAWNEIASFESVATVQSAMGDGSVAFSFVAPNARKLVQTMPGGNAKLELGSVGSIAWMGEPGRARAVDPRMAEELAGGGDLLTLVRSIDARFTDFKLMGRETIDGVLCWKISMRPLQSPAVETRWTLLLAAADATIVGLEIPAPPKDLAPNAPVQGGQSMRFRRWEAVERGAAPKPEAEAKPGAEPKPSAESKPSAKPDATDLLAFREATITTGGMKVDLIYTRVAVNTLAKDAIAPPADLEPAPSRPAALP
ncbi:MAG: hypothetical protein RLY21_2226 [Planctomycetota bacterium]|jgi:hypothetical protein